MYGYDGHQGSPRYPRYVTLDDRMVRSFWTMASGDQLCLLKNLLSTYGMHEIRKWQSEYGEEKTCSQSARELYQNWCHWRDQPSPHLETAEQLQKYRPNQMALQCHLHTVEGRRIKGALWKRSPVQGEKWGHGIHCTAEPCFRVSLDNGTIQLDQLVIKTCRF